MKKEAENRRDENTAGCCLSFSVSRNRGWKWYNSIINEMKENSALGDRGGMNGSCFYERTDT